MKDSYLSWSLSSSDIAVDEDTAASTRKHVKMTIVTPASNPHGLWTFNYADLHKEFI